MAAYSSAALRAAAASACCCIFKNSAARASCSATAFSRERRCSSSKRFSVSTSTAMACNDTISLSCAGFANLGACSVSGTGA